MKSKRKTGEIYERKAESLLLNLGYRILERNVVYPWGEIDLVTYDSACKEIVFVEVRYRKAGAWLSAPETIGPKKKSRLKKAIWTWLMKREKTLLACYPAKGIRIDLVAYDGGSVTHHQNYITD